MASDSLHPIVAAAARGELPGWARAGSRRRDHMARVAALMDKWANRLGLGDRDRARWRAAGLLHDVLREAEPSDLRKRLEPPLSELPGPVLHGPAAAAKLRREGVEDEPLLLAIAFHTIGHPDFDRMGRALSAADFLEPGRMSLPSLRRPLRKRMPKQLDSVITEIMAARLSNLVDKERPISPFSIGFWNVLVAERGE